MNVLINQSAEIIKKILYINIATITPSGKPWNSPVYCAYDKDLAFYWLSWKLNQHSKNIRNDSSAFVTIYDSTVPAGTGFGVYFEGDAYELTSPSKIITALKLLYGREKRKPRDIIYFLKKFPRRAYKFVPKKAWINGDRDIEGQFIDIRTELDLDLLRKAVLK